MTESDIIELKNNLQRVELSMNTAMMQFKSFTGIDNNEYAKMTVQIKVNTKKLKKSMDDLDR